MKIRYLTAEVSSRCDMDCGFCFSFWREQDLAQEMDTEEVIQCLEYLRSRGLEAINFTGGEPLLRGDIDELLQFAHDSGLTTVLSTNGTLLAEKLPYIADYLDFVNLPLDSVLPDVHNQMRPTKAVPDHYQHVGELIDLLSRDYSRIGVKINTLVSGKNRNSIQGIGDLIDGNVIAWKLSQFIASGYGEQHESEFAISGQEYRDVVDGCRRAYPGLNIVSGAAHTCDDRCRILSFAGHLLRPTDSGLEDLGSLLTAPEARLMEGFDATMNRHYFDRAYGSRQKEGQDVR